MKKFVIATCLLMVLGGIWLFIKVIMPQAEGVVTEFHERYNSRDFEYIYREMASEEFKKAVPYGSYTDFMNRLYKKFGEATFAKRTGWGMFYKNIGLTFNLGYDTTAEKGHIDESFILLKGKNGWRIFQYNPIDFDRKNSPANPGRRKI